MKERLSVFFKKTNEKRMKQFIFVFAIGFILMCLGNMIDPKEHNESSRYKAEEVSKAEEPKNVELALEERLERILSRAEGVGEVSVLITFSNNGLIELAKDTAYERTETLGGEAQGRSALTEKRETTHVLLQGKDGSSEPIIIKNTQPKIEGVIIVAEGGDNAIVKAALTKAAGALLDLPAHKIEVMKMKEE